MTEDDDTGSIVMAWMVSQPVPSPQTLVPCREEKWISNECIERVFTALEDGPKTITEVSLLTGYGVSHIGLVMRWFIKEGDVVRIDGTYPRTYRLT